MADAEQIIDHGQPSHREASATYEMYGFPIVIAPEALAIKKMCNFVIAITPEAPATESPRILTILSLLVAEASKASLAGIDLNNKLALTGACRLSAPNLLLLILIPIARDYARIERR